MYKTRKIPKLLRIPEVASLLGIPQGAVRKRIFLGQLPRLKIGHNVYVPYDKLMKMIDEKTIDPY
ncbi:MAG: helix-turn-helix domain-containing protein [Thermodesulfobacteriota bacterium]